MTTSLLVPDCLSGTFLDPAGLHPDQILDILDLALHLLDRMREFKLRITVVVHASNPVSVLGWLLGILVVVGLEIVGVSDGLVGRLAVHSLFICYIMGDKQHYIFFGKNKAKWAGRKGVPKKCRRARKRRNDGMFSHICEITYRCFAWDKIIF